MKYFKFISIDSKGFTLVEVIATLVAAGILGAIFIQFMGTALDASWNSVEMVRDESGAEALMEQIVAEYVADINADPPNDPLGNVVDNYNGQTIRGITITTKYIYFDSSGDEQLGGSDNLKVVLQAPSQVSPAVRFRHPLITVLTNSRIANDDHIVLY